MTREGLSSSYGGAACAQPSLAFLGALERIVAHCGEGPPSPSRQKPELLGSGTWTLWGMGTDSSKASGPPQEVGGLRVAGQVPLWRQEEAGPSDPHPALGTLGLFPISPSLEGMSQLRRETVGPGTDIYTWLG